MRPTLIDFLSSALDAPIARLRRHAISMVVCAVGAVGAAYFASSAALLALEPQVGPVYARLILAGVFAAIALCAIAIPRLGTRPESIVERAQANAKAMPKNDRMAMIIEAILLGFNASNTRKAANK